MESLKIHGHWWLPGREDRKVPGVLEFDTEAAGRLTLVGALSQVTDLAPMEPADGGGLRQTITQDILDAHGTYSRIHGQSRNKAYTLDNCFELKSSGGMFDEPYEQTIYVNRMFEDVWYDNDGTLGGDSIAFDAEGLTVWSGKTGVSGHYADDAASSGRDILLEGRKLAKESVQLADGGSLALYHHLSLQDDSLALSIAERFSIGLKYSDLRTVDDLLDVASDLQDLISIGVDRAAAFGQVNVIHPDHYQERGERRITLPITVRAAWSAATRPNQKPLRRHDTYFDLNDLGGLSTVAKWMEHAAKHRSALGRVMATKYANSMYVSDRFLNRAAALEGFDRVETATKKGPAFAARLRRCIDLAGQPFLDLTQSPKKWVREFVDHRNEIAHHYGRRMREATEEQLYLADSAYWLFVFCMLRKAGAPDGVFDKIIGDARLVFLKRRLTRVLA